MKRIIVGISGASGMPVAVGVLEALKAARVETHLVISAGAAQTIKYETGINIDDVKALASAVYDLDDYGAAISSGTFKTDGMIVVPASMKTVAGIANGFSENLLLRAADVVIKERRKLVIVAREMPLSQIHLKNLLILSRTGAIIMPLMMSFYNQPKTVDDMIDHAVGKILDCFDIDYEPMKRWKA